MSFRPGEGPKTIPSEDKSLFNRSSTPSFTLLPLAELINRSAVLAISSGTQTDGAAICDKSELNTLLMCA